MQGLHFENPWCWISYGYQLFRWYESHPKCHIEALRKWTAMKGFRVPSVSLATSFHRGSPRVPSRICTGNWNLKLVCLPKKVDQIRTYSPCAHAAILEQWDPFSSNLHFCSWNKQLVAGRSSIEPNQCFGVCLPRPSSKPNCFATNAARLACYKTSVVSWLRLQRGGPFLWVLRVILSSKRLKHHQFSVPKWHKHPHLDLRYVK